MDTIALKKLRTERNLTQKSLAEVLGINRTTYVKYETGVSEPDNDTLVALAKYFDVTTDLLLGHAIFDSTKKDTENTLDAYDQQIIDYCSSLDEEKKKAVLSYLQFLAQDKK